MTAMPKALSEKSDWAVDRTRVLCLQRYFRRVEVLHGFEPEKESMYTKCNAIKQTSFDHGWVESYHDTSNGRLAEVASHATLLSTFTVLISFPAVPYARREVPEDECLD